MPMVINNPDPEWYHGHCALCGKEITDSEPRVLADWKRKDRTKQIMICQHCDLLVKYEES